MATAAPEPQRFGKYQILERIAAGGMAEIFKARLDGINGFHRAFAIKRILPNLTANPDFVAMLVDEAKIAGLLSHANIVQILDFGAVDQQYYIAMEYVNGRDLGQVMARCQEKGITMPAPHAVYILIEMLKGLEYAHNRQVMRGSRPVRLNIVHRDISPANVLVSFQGEVKLTDFGIAKASVNALETMAGVVKGRFDFMSPEQAAGGPVDQRSDLFSAGVVLYELLTGRHPFRVAGDATTLENIRRGSFPLPSEVNPDVPATLDRVVEQALAVSPEHRFANATVFKESLDRFFHDSGFIFSASTLGNFARGLFPDADTRPTRPAPAETDELELDEPSATGEAPRGTGFPRQLPPAGSVVPAPRPPPSDAAREMLSSLRSAPPPGSSGTFGPAAGIGEESTLIRPNPTAHSEWGDAETVIRPGSNTSQDPPTRTVMEPVAAPQRIKVVYRTPTRVHVLWLSVVLSIGLIGLLSGALLGSRLGTNAVGEKPILEVQFPVGATVTVAGTTLVGPPPRRAEVPADTDVVVKVTTPSGTSSTTVRLAPHELRVVNFNSSDVKDR